MITRFVLTYAISETDRTEKLDFPDNVTPLHLPSEGDTVAVHGHTGNDGLYTVVARTFSYFLAQPGVDAITSVVLLLKPVGN